MRWQILLIATLPAARIILGGTAAADEQVDYLQQIKPVLVERCYACHGALKQESGLRLDTAASAIQGGDSGPAITPGDADASLLLQRVTASELSERMPPEGEPLKAEQIAALRNWIARNAQSPADEQPERDPREHWAFRPIVRPPVPEVANAAWVRNPIDAFISRKHEQHGLIPQVEASREVLLRRLCFDLIGLPPADAETARLDSDRSDSQYEQLVQQLLEDPRHGERWARHWMDIWRYSDWWGLGDQLRNSQPHIWHWRDWIIESLNANAPYDEMVRLMLAADELYPDDLDKLRATGFLARNYFLFNRNQWMEETVEHVSKGFLGLTMNCAKCHDHKFDPISHADFYRMRAFFEPYHVRLDVVPGEPDLARDGIPRVFDGLLDAPTYRFERGQESQPDKSAAIAPGVPQLLEFNELAIEPVSLPKGAWQPERRPWVLESYLTAAQKHLTDTESLLAASLAKQAAPGSSGAADLTTDQLSDAEAALQVAELAVEASRAALISVERRAAAERAGWVQADESGDDASLIEPASSADSDAVKAERRAAHAKAKHTVADIEFKMRHVGADRKEALEKELVAARELLVKAEQSAVAEITPADKYTPFIGAKWTPTRFQSSTQDDPRVEFAAHSTGRRTALAAWITDPLNPLTARVAVNHIWARHMGTPLVATVFDFGRKGSPPSHPELLDWLAAELIDSGWDMKHLHQLIVMSSTYRMSSSIIGRDDNAAKDTDNHLLWRRTPIRLESQAVRDSILSFAGTLDLTLGGPPVPAAEQAGSKRRSLYFFHSNNDRNLFLTTFDEASVKECYRRDQSVVPQQALALSNSRLVHDAARQIAERLSLPQVSGQPPPNDQEFIERAFYRLLGIGASDKEVRACMKALKQWRTLPDAADEEPNDLARVYFVWALLNHNDFVTVR
ncbi:MAG: DUF1553 domain-containing protein [Pirellulales bacterium]